MRLGDGVYDMRNIATAFIATSLAGWMLAGSTTGASARSHHHHCGSCGGGYVAPTTIYKTVHPQRFETRYRDVSRTRHVHRVHRVTTIVQVQPIIHVHEVTRVHHHTVFTTSNAYYRHTVQLAAIHRYSHSVESLYDCGCRP